jgi:tRNA pseudouridine55 synthase
VNGLFVAVDKPVGITSHDVVDIVRGVTGIKKIGHAGTLDPNASGVLVIAIGREATKQIAQQVQKRKEYVAGVLLDRVSDTDDVMGKVKKVEDRPSLTKEQIQKVLPQFLGMIDQVPPKYSAVKIQGQEAYKRSRRGEQITMESRKVRVDEIEVLDYHWPLLILKISTGPGVYIRSIARDLGAKLFVGGCLQTLRRTRVGEWQVENAVFLDELPKWWEDQVANSTSGLYKYSIY